MNKPIDWKQLNDTQRILFKLDNVMVQNTHNSFLILLNFISLVYLMCISMLIQAQAYENAKISLIVFVIIYVCFTLFSNFYNSYLLRKIDNKVKGCLK